MEEMKRSLAALQKKIDAREAKLNEEPAAKKKKMSKDATTMEEGEISEGSRDEVD